MSEEHDKKLQAAKTQDRKKNPGKGSKETHDQDQEQNQIVEANKCLELENVELKTKISCTEKRVEELEGQLEGAEMDKAQVEDSHVEVEAKLKDQKTLIDNLQSEIDALLRKAIDEAEAQDEKHHEEKSKMRKEAEDRFNEITSAMQKNFEAKARQQKQESDQIIAQLRKDQQESQTLQNNAAKNVTARFTEILDLQDTIQAQNRLLATVGLGPLANAPVNASDLPNQGPHAGVLPPQHSSASAMYPQGHRLPVPHGQHFPRAFPVNHGQGSYGVMVAWGMPMVSPWSNGVPQHQPDPNVEEPRQTRDSLDLGADDSTSPLVRLPVAAASTPANSGRQLR
ncbi:MAG: hypothetical protein Q9212_001377 [Teloschistes hypoglaucus]